MNRNPSNIKRDQTSPDILLFLYDLYVLCAIIKKIDFCLFFKLFSLHLLLFCVAHKDLEFFAEKQKSV